MSKNNLRFIDLFAGIGGTRIGFEDACSQQGFSTLCVFSSEIKAHAIQAYKTNFHDKEIAGDIQKIAEHKIPNFDYLLAGFPCQPFSSAGKRKGFLDDRGSLFFDIIRILKAKKPIGFLLENVDGLVNHDNGKTFNEIIKTLKNLGYNISWSILNAADFGVPQNRKRVYIVGHLKKKIQLTNFDKKSRCIQDILEENIPLYDTKFSKLLLENYTIEQLTGKSIKDKRGGNDNIHSWDINLKGQISKEQKALMNILLKKRRMKKWATLKGIVWMDGMPLTVSEIETFYQHPKLQGLLDDLTKKGYLKLEHPKNIFIKNGGIRVREYDTTKEKGYNIVAGKLSFPISKIIDPKGYVPTIVATEIGKLAIPVGNGIRGFTVREGLRLSGYPETYSLDKLDYYKAFDLIGNTVMPPVIKEIVVRMLS
ncbi:MAG: DNA cytosine methyltransferase [Rickettsia endosymbiont of Sergentomyia squamirostris]|uniref:Cytosine-specific methyltransferase n=1 Tax=Candidatus Tisiphia endosymbiont of Sergentomyia squamirostris TaxID=3113639 RepID=A0AAT9G8G3_9RICK